MLPSKNHSENQASHAISCKLCPHPGDRSFGRDITNSFTSFLNLKCDNQVSEYIQDIYETLESTEEALMPRFGYMLHQEKLNERMRSVLIDWLIEVHFKFKLADETLYLTVNIIDRFLQTTQVAKENLQLVGVSSMFIACKYEEIYPPEVKDFVYITDNTYDIPQLLKTERLILRALNFSLTTPSSFGFLLRFSGICQIDEFSFNLARFALELALVDYRFLRFKPSVLAISAILAAQRVLRFHCTEISEGLHFDEEQVGNCTKEMVLALFKAKSSNLQGTRKKFLSEQFLAVAQVEIRL